MTTLLNQTHDVLSRHIFAIGNAAYQTMLRTEHKQAIIISGETGAGKTESTRLLVEFLAAVNQTNGSLVTKQVHNNLFALKENSESKIIKRKRKNDVQKGKLYIIQTNENTRRN